MHKFASRRSGIPPRGSVGRVATLGLWGEALVLLLVLWLASSGPKRARVAAAKIRATPDDPLPQVNLYKRSAARVWALAAAAALSMMASEHPIVLGMDHLATSVAVVLASGVAVVLPLVVIWRR